MSDLDNSMVSEAHPIEIEHARVLTTLVAVKKILQSCDELVQDSGGEMEEQINYYEQAVKSSINIINEVG